MQFSSARTNLQHTETMPDPNQIDPIVWWVYDVYAAKYDFSFTFLKILKFLRFKKRCHSLSKAPLPCRAPPSYQALWHDRGSSEIPCCERRVTGTRLPVITGISESHLEAMRPFPNVSLQWLQIQRYPKNVLLVDNLAQLTNFGRWNHFLEWFRLTSAQQSSEAWMAELKVDSDTENPHLFPSFKRWSHQNPCGNTLDSQAAYRASTSCCSEDGLDGRFNARSTRSAGHLASWRITWALVKVEKKHDAKHVPTFANYLQHSAMFNSYLWKLLAMHTLDIPWHWFMMTWRVLSWPGKQNHGTAAAASFFADFAALSPD